MDWLDLLAVQTEWHSKSPQRKKSQEYLIKLSIHKQVQRNALFVFEEKYYLIIQVIKYFCLIYLTRVSFLLRSICLNFLYTFIFLYAVVVQSLSRVQLFVTPWIAAYQASLSFKNSQSLLKLMSIELVMASNHLILCHPLLLLPSIFPSIRVFSCESVLHIRWPKYWSFSFSISPSNEYSGLISFQMDWFDHVAVQGTLKSLLQHHSSKTAILQHSAFFFYY